MRLEYLHDGLLSRPLIRIYEFDVQEAICLQTCVSELSHGSKERVIVHELPGVEAMSECHLVFEAGDQNIGVVQEQMPNSFKCILTAIGWDEVAGLIEPFCSPLVENSSFQWLNETGPISLLLSPGGHW